MSKNFFLRQLGHWSLFGKTFCSPSGPTDSNDTGLKTVALPGAESIAVQTDIHSWIL
jgi:hypothetical protein